MKFLKPALAVLKRYDKEPGKNLKLIVARELEQGTGSALDTPGRKAVTRTVYGVIRNEELLLYALQKVSHRKLSKIQAPVLQLLKTAAYLLLFSRSYPAYAVVNEVVACAGAKTKGFVNAVLRRLAKQEQSLLTELEAINDPGIKYSISNLLIENLKCISTDLDQDLDYLDREPLFHLRVNSRKVSADRAGGLLAEKGIEYRELKAFHSFQVKEVGNVLDEMKDTHWFYVQNTASQLISIIAARYGRRSVLDCCAAPGTKSVTLALLNPGLTVCANDIHPGRARLVGDFVSRIGLAKVHTVVSDINAFSFKTGFDFILVDAPCTSSGTLRKNPDLKRKIDRDRIARSARDQLKIMKILTTCGLTAGSHILYSVCSFIEAETEGIMEQAFTRRPVDNSFETVNLEPLCREYGFRYKTGTYGTYLLPDPQLNNDLFYFSLLRKN
jgi:16S rRNA (cytosine967-C5)-methyltransferase